jgi:hypothetical protein
MSAYTARLMLFSTVIHRFGWQNDGAYDNSDEAIVMSMKEM